MATFGDDVSSPASQRPDLAAVALLRLLSSSMVCHGRRLSTTAPPLPLSLSPTKEGEDPTKEGVDQATVPLLPLMAARFSDGDPQKRFGDNQCLEWKLPQLIWKQ